MQYKNPESINDEIIKQEKGFWTAMCTQDLKSMLDMTDFPCLLAGSQGSHAFHRDEFIKMYELGEGKVKNFEFDDKSIEVRQLSPDTAVIAYKVKCTFEHKGQDKTIEAADTSTWIKRHGKWVCAMHTESELTDKH